MPEANFTEFLALSIDPITTKHCNFYKVANSESDSEFFIMACKWSYWTTKVSCELSLPVGKTEFSSTAKNRTNSVS